MGILKRKVVAATLGLRAMRKRDLPRQEAKCECCNAGKVAKDSEGGGGNHIQQRPKFILTITPEKHIWGRSDSVSSLEFFNRLGLVQQAPLAK